MFLGAPAIMYTLGGLVQKLYFTYVLRCVDTKLSSVQFYTGSTTDLKSRVQNHKSGNTRSTKRFDKIDLLYFEGCLNKTDAIKRENQLKTGFGRGYLKRRLENYLKTLRD